MESRLITFKAEDTLSNQKEFEIYINHLDPFKFDQSLSSIPPAIFALALATQKSDIDPSGKIYIHTVSKIITAPYQVKYKFLIVTPETEFAKVVELDNLSIAKIHSTPVLTNKKRVPFKIGALPEQIGGPSINAAVNIPLPPLENANENPDIVSPALTNAYANVFIAYAEVMLKYNTCYDKSEVEKKQNWLNGYLDPNKLSDENRQSIQGQLYVMYAEEKSQLAEISLEISRNLNALIGFTSTPSSACNKQKDQLKESFDDFHEKSLLQKNLELRFIKRNFIWALYTSAYIFYQECKARKANISIYTQTLFNKLFAPFATLDDNGNISSIDSAYKNLSNRQLDSLALAVNRFYDPANLMSFEELQGLYIEENVDQTDTDSSTSDVFSRLRNQFSKMGKNITTMRKNITTTLTRSVPMDNVKFAAQRAIDLFAQQMEQIPDGQRAFILSDSGIYWDVGATEIEGRLRDDGLLPVEQELIDDYVAKENAIKQQQPIIQEKFEKILEQFAAAEEIINCIVRESQQRYEIKEIENKILINKEEGLRLLRQVERDYNDILNLEREMQGLVQDAIKLEVKLRLMALTADEQKKLNDWMPLAHKQLPNIERLIAERKKIDAAYLELLGEAKVVQPETDAPRDLAEEIKELSVKVEGSNRFLKVLQDSANQFNEELLSTQITCQVLTSLNKDLEILFMKKQKEVEREARRQKKSFISQYSQRIAVLTLVTAVLLATAVGIAIATGGIVPAAVGIVVLGILGVSSVPLSTTAVGVAVLMVGAAIAGACAGLFGSLFSVLLNYCCDKPSPAAPKPHQRPVASSVRSTVGGITGFLRNSSPAPDVRQASSSVVPPDHRDVTNVDFARAISRLGIINSVPKPRKDGAHPDLVPTLNAYK